MELPTPMGPIVYRSLDHQATLGAYVGVTALQDGRGVVKDFVFVDGKSVMSSDAEVGRLRPHE